MIRPRHLPRLQGALLLAIATPLTLTACWLPPKDVIKEKAAARKAWRTQEKQRESLRQDFPAQAARVTAASGPRAATSVPANMSVGPMVAPKPATSVAPAAVPPAPALASKPKPAKATKAIKAKDTPAATRQMAQLTPVEGVANMVAITRPSSPLAVSAPWQDMATPAQLGRIDGWLPRFEADKAAVIAGGDGVEIAKQGRLFEIDAAMLYGMIPPGLYDCRLWQINAAGTLWHEGGSGRCRVLTDGKSRRISFITAQEIILGDLHENDGFSSVYLGGGLVANMGGLGGVVTGEIGLVQRIADTRWRIILPMDGQSGSAVVEITRPRLAE